MSDQFRQRIEAMVAAGRLGDKTRGGFYRKTPGGLETLDPTTGDYRPQQKPRLALLKELKDRTLVILVTCRADRSWIAKNNRIIWAANAKIGRAHV